MTFLKKNIVRINDRISEIGMTNQTILTLPVRERRYATGISTISCLAIDTLSPATTKLRLIVLMAGTPISSMAGEKVWPACTHIYRR